MIVGTGKWVGCPMGLPLRFSPGKDHCVRLCRNSTTFTTMKTKAAMKAHSSGGRNLVNMKNTPIASPKASMIWHMKMMIAQARPRTK